MCHVIALFSLSPGRNQHTYAHKHTHKVQDKLTRDKSDTTRSTHYTLIITHGTEGGREGEREGGREGGREESE